MHSSGKINVSPLLSEHFTGNCCKLYHHWIPIAPLLLDFPSIALRHCRIFRFPTRQRRKRREVSYVFDNLPLFTIYLRLLLRFARNINTMMIDVDWIHTFLLLLDFLKVSHALVSSIFIVDTIHLFFHNFHSLFKPLAIFL